MAKKTVEDVNLSADNENQKVSDGTSYLYRFRIKWLLVFYDVCIYFLSGFFLLGLIDRSHGLNAVQLLVQLGLGFVCVFVLRFITDIYRQVWRYGGIQSYLKLVLSDVCATAVYCLLELVLPWSNLSIVQIVSVCGSALIVSLAIRMIYRYAYKCVTSDMRLGKFLCSALHVFGGKSVDLKVKSESQKIKIAIVGAGRVGVGLAEELINSVGSAYIPRCFIDISKEKIGRRIYGIPVLSQDDANFTFVHDYGIQEIVFALPQIDAEEKKKLYEYFREAKCKMKVYDYPIIQSTNRKRHLREFDIEELLFRAERNVTNERTVAYYKDKRVLITGGGGSIGSELCRQIAKMGPQQLVILDVYENGAYDIQQELKMAYGAALNLSVEIVSVCNKAGLERVFDEYRPQVVLNAAAHKHVPLMEHNCIEAVENNVFGTLNTVELSEKYGVERFMMVSTDKAVNPTNVMGATKRMCEMIVQAHSKKATTTTFSATRFGNVLGSAGSVVPLFRRQIANGGPLTVTDKRIIRYFMTIPEASQLVLQSAAMAKNGELFVLDMGKPVKILELAENMIRVSGMEPYKDIDIVETGLRPGEKLYEELLVKTDDLEKTDNSLIFVEREEPESMEAIEEKLRVLREAVATGDDNVAREVLRKVVPTFRKPEEVNATAAKSNEMKQAR